MERRSEDSVSERSYDGDVKAHLLPIPSARNGRRSPSLLPERLAIARPTRRRLLLAVLVLATVGSLPFLVSHGLNTHLSDSAQTLALSDILPFGSTERDATGAASVLPVHLHPETYLQGNGPMSHFRGTYVRLYHTNARRASPAPDRLRNDTQYMTTFLGAGFSE